MRNESEIPFADNPFTIPVADRVKRLPPYLFGKINKLKYEKRVAGIDVIDLGMGNPTDAPDPLIIDKLAEALAGSAQPPLLGRQRHRQPAQEVAVRYYKQVRRPARPRRRSHRLPSARRKASATCAWPCWGRATRPSSPRRRSRFTSTRSCSPSGNVHRARRPRPARVPRATSPTPASTSIPKPKLVILNFPHNPSGDRHRAGLLRRAGRSSPRSTASWSSATSPTATSASTATRPRASSRRPARRRSASSSRR